MKLTFTHWCGASVWACECGIGGGGSRGGGGGGGTTTSETKAEYPPEIRPLVTSSVKQIQGLQGGLPLSQFGLPNVAPVPGLAPFTQAGFQLASQTPLLTGPEQSLAALANPALSLAGGVIGTQLSADPFTEYLIRNLTPGAPTRQGFPPLFLPALLSTFLSSMQQPIPFLTDQAPTSAFPSPPALPSPPAPTGGAPTDPFGPVPFTVPLTPAPPTAPPPNAPMAPPPTPPITDDVLQRAVRFAITSPYGLYKDPVFGLRAFSDPPSLYRHWLRAHGFDVNSAPSIEEAAPRLGIGYEAGAYQGRGHPLDGWDPNNPSVPPLPGGPGPNGENPSDLP